MKIEEELARCKDWIVPAIDREKEVDWGWVEKGVLNGDLQLWPGDKSAVVTRVSIKECGDDVQFLFAGGELSEIADGIVPAVEIWAKSQSIKTASLIARPGWSKKLHGYTKSKLVKLYKEL